VGNIVPDDMRDLCAAFDRGDLAAARALHHKLFALCRDLLGLASNPIPIKAAMAMLGRDSGQLRLPLVALEPPLADRLRLALEAYGLPVAARA
jgi:4-hydroxy-tetrahydrodipicolinate synthase